MKSIVFRNVSFSYGKKKVLENLSFSAENGEKICLFGPSGCGKSTVLRLLCGLNKPQSGKIEVQGSIRPVFQEDLLLPFLSTEQNVKMFAKGDVGELLSRLGLFDERNEPPSRLSGGMARRAAIARAIAGEGDIYVFDEPFNGLDSENVLRCAEVIKERTEGKTAVFVLHSKADAELLGCRIIEMS